ncbi:trypsin-like peptidase domain-containing protein [Mesorhizobium sp. B4-1-4]|uniref:trypsin-like peptidase domain-containing protein n=1 Tax=Mesorhizobium sp. B4-1-4 TaxID=2589888 RepID=UPI00112EC2AD|nr:serine protease [Mesorhizobium sp. B4-1-4]UCI33816.1 serine protease [Mesorhizobium sp. B4-1-4]
MRLEEQWRKCTVVIGSAKAGTENDIVPWCTGFLVDAAQGKPWGKYVVTAAHALTDKDDCPVDIRFNTKDGSSRNYYVDTPCWITHPTDDNVDVAVLPIDIPDWADCTLILQQPTVMDDFKFRTKNIGVGSRTYTVGLWKFLHGENRNQPFVYTGHIGLVPEDQKVPVRPWAPSHRNERVLVDAYLVEGEPLDGVSGAPVFVRRTIDNRLHADLDPKGKTKTYVEGSIWLLGMHSDSFTGKAGVEYQMPPGGTFIVPRGVNVVVPSMKINEVLNHPDLKRARKSSEDDASLPDKSSLSAEEVVRRRDAGLRKALNTPPEPKTKPDAV